MRSLISVLFVLSVGCLMPVYSLAGDWETYVEVNKRFYFLDEQEFTEIMCKVDVPAINNVLKQAMEQLVPAKSKVAIEENLKDFKLVYGRANGLSFDKPKIEAKFTSGETLPNSDRAQQGLELVNNGFKMQIDGVVLIIDSIFELYLKPNKDKTRLISITGTQDPVGVKYYREGMTVESVIDGAIIRDIGHKDGLEVRSEGKCIKIKDKYLVDEINGVINQTSAKTDLEMKIGYQDVGGIVFPQKIVTKHSLVADTVKQEAINEIFFTDCKVR